MKIRILSDLHREFGPSTIPEIPADLILLAGDISTKTNALPWLQTFCGKTPTAYVCGNHEFYGEKFPRLIQKLKDSTAASNIHILENDFFCLGDWFIYGCSLWTDLALQGDWQVGAEFARDGMNDYKRIRHSDRGYKRLEPRDTRLIHQRSLEHLRQFFESHDPARTIVLTHHAPSALSLQEDQRGKSMSAAYASHLDDFIMTHQPSLWVHGHLHHQNDYHLGKTRVVSNPQGYPTEPNPDFDPSWILEL